jgi:hypothetical protein
MSHSPQRAIVSDDYLEEIGNHAERIPLERHGIDGKLVVLKIGPSSHELQNAH